jgi:5'-methylthioadenosine phosphorylase
VVSIASVGGIHAELTPGRIVIPDQIIDYTYGRKHTYREGSDTAVVHMDFTEPYCEGMRQLCMQAAGKAGESYVDGGVYACSQGPRLETKAEIDRLERDGATMVGMTGMPEAFLARELGLCYAAIGVVANHAAGRGTSAQAVQYDQIGVVLKGAMQQVRAILEHLVALHASS